MSDIGAGSGRAELIRQAAVVIWDEAPAVACVDSVCQLVMGSTLPFGGKTVVFLGDFRQTCPVILRASKQEVIDASIKSAALWSQFSVHALTTPIRNAEDPEFALCVDAIGDGAGPVVDLSILASVPAARDLVNFVYPPPHFGRPGIVQISRYSCTNKRANRCFQCRYFEQSGRHIQTIHCR